MKDGLASKSDVSEVCTKEGRGNAEHNTNNEERDGSSRVVAGRLCDSQIYSRRSSLYSHQLDVMDRTATTELG